MTTATPPVPGPVTGANLGVAYFAIRKNLLEVLDDYDLTFEQSLLLNYLSRGDTPRDDLVAMTAGNIKVSAAEVESHLDAAIARGLIADGLTLTADGERLQQQITERSQPLTRTFFADIPAEDLAATARVLATLTERANAALAAS
ncbi:LigA [Nocardioidaceae bacterium Broad-1]|nr:LigA [Nocardioidaceae bacterium Broad-1]